MIFFTSDPHFGHANILKHQADTRKYDSVHEMNRDYTKRWNSQVTPKDTVYHLGDFSWGNPLRYLEKLNGQIKIVPGNHDHRRIHNGGFDGAKTKDGHLEILPLIHVLKIQKLNQMIVLCHYPMWSWPHSAHKSWHLYGHAHRAVDHRPYTMHVGVDGNNGRLWSLDEVVEHMKQAA